MINIFKFSDVYSAIIKLKNRTNDDSDDHIKFIDKLYVIYIKYNILYF